MLAEQGDVLLAGFPYSDTTGEKLRPVLVLARVPGPFPDLLLMFISTQVHLAQPGVDFVIDPSHPEFRRSGLKLPSVFRCLKLGALSEPRCVAKLGSLSKGLYTELIRPLLQAIAGKRS